NGTWSIRGSLDSGQDYVMVNGAVVAATGDTISGSSTERYADDIFSATFFLNITNGNGDYLVGGVTDTADVDANAVIMLNGDLEVLREGDAVDLDGDGIFNDGVYIHIFHNDDIVLTDSLTLYALVSLRDDTGAEIGEAMITKVVPAPGALALIGLGIAATRRRR
ncbi:MAG: PEP-CTERM sorting domain-containing protein, partial [Phycisphaerales bacterium]|nr:PEP-CTERM sorting domain-containing protein [Phycisphaerales bacterium]